METSSKDDIRYLNAKKRVKQIKGFYVHAAIFFGVVLLSVGLKLLKNSTINLDNLWGFGLWAIGLFFHALSTFAKNFPFGRDWEKKKIKELMDKNKN